MEKVSVRVPFNGWEPRPHQEKLWEYFPAGGKRAIAVWHRRAGKDEVCLHIHGACDVRGCEITGTCLPEFDQGRRAIWTASKSLTPARGGSMKFSRTRSELTPTTTKCLSASENGSTWQCLAPTAMTQQSAQRCRNCIQRICVGEPVSVGVPQADTSKKTTAGRRSSLLPEDAIIVFPCFSMPLNPQSGSANCSPQRYRRSQQTKLLPKP